MKQADDRPARMHIPRSRGAVTGLFLVILGFWGALVPFVGPNFEFAYTPGQDWTAARGWLEVLPGVATVVGGLLVIVSAHRAPAMLGGWLAALGGAWFVVGQAFAPLLRIGSVGDPVAATERKRVALELAYFSGLGVLIAFLAGAVLSRLAVRLARDVQTLPPSGPAAPVVPAPVAQPAEPYYSGLEEPHDALTTPAPPIGSAEAEGEPRRRHSLRRHRAPAEHAQQ